MEDRFKYRGLTIGGEWVYGFIHILERKLGNVDAGTYISNAGGSPFAFQIRPETVGQCTGLKDRNGKFIFDGDILGIKRPWWKVYWKDGGFRCEDVNELGNEDKTLRMAHQDDSLQILGNIYENPQMCLKKEEHCYEF